MTVFGNPHLHLRVAGSTNERARELAEQGAPSGTLVTAAAQTAGRGRRGRIWSAPEGKALLYSAILRPLGPEHSLLPLAVPLAVCEAVESLAPVECVIKWPNDVWIEQKKVGGILIEARPPEWAVIGVGVNVSIEPHEFPADLRWPATSVGHGATIEAACESLCEALGHWTRAGRREILDAFRARDGLAGREVEWEEGSGRALGIDDDGELLVELAGGGRATLGAGEVSLALS